LQHIIGVVIAIEPDADGMPVIIRNGFTNDVKRL
jgi:hypothetical protein